jgi:hypothetical protein
MTGWRIDPTGLNKILTDTNTAVQAVGTALDGSVETVGEVQAAGGYDGIVSTAFSGFMQEIFDGTITGMFAKYTGALEGTANAANAYLAGDEDIAGTIASGIGSSDFNAALFAPPSSSTDGGEG